VLPSITGQPTVLLCKSDRLSSDGFRQQVEKYASMLDDALVPPWSKLDRSNTRTLEGARPPPFESQSQLDSTRAYASGLLWRLFDVSSHTHCGANPVHTVVCKHHAQEEI
jgi:hypothetical protein